MLVFYFKGTITKPLIGEVRICKNDQTMLLLAKPLSGTPSQFSFQFGTKLYIRLERLYIVVVNYCAF